MRKQIHTKHAAAQKIQMKYSWNCASTRTKQIEHSAKCIQSIIRTLKHTKLWNAIDDRFHIILLLWLVCRLHYLLLPNWLLREVLLGCKQWESFCSSIVPNGSANIQCTAARVNFISMLIVACIVYWETVFRSATVVSYEIDMDALSLPFCAAVLSLLNGVICKWY